MFQDVAVEAIAIHKCPAGLQRCIGFSRLADRFLGRRNPAGSARALRRDPWIGAHRAKCLHLDDRAPGIPGFRRQFAVYEMNQRENIGVARVILLHRDCLLGGDGVVQAGVDIR